MLLGVICLLVSLVVADANELLIRRQFLEWIAEHQKTYTTEEETAFRFQSFKSSLLRIQQQNQRTQANGFGATYALNRFSDLTPEEFRKTILVKPFLPTPSENRESPLDIDMKDAVPTSFDWRKKGMVTPVKDQGQCGSCWAFSVTENIESVWMLAKGLNSSSMTPLAPQQIVDCDDYDMGCSGGNPPTAYQYVISAGGLDTEASYPYKALDGTCAFKSNSIGAKISGYDWATESGDEETLKKNLVGWSPLSICVDARYWQDYSSGIMTADECDWIVELDHCVQLVGYDTTGAVPFWIVRNSWGTDWGEHGFIRLQLGDNTCGLTEEASSAKP